MSAGKIAKILLSLGAVKLNYSEPFRYASGILSPIYCDNRILLSHPAEHKQVIASFLEVLKPLDFDVVAGVATSGIPHAAIIAEKLGKPLIYVRPKKKEHGTSKQIEGELKVGQKVIVIEDLISTGGSSAAAVEAVEAAGGTVTHCIAIFTYQMKKAEERFKGLCQVIALSDFSALIETAVAAETLSAEDAEKIRSWNKDPEGWAKEQA